MSDAYRAMCAELTDDLEEWVDGYLINDPVDEHTSASFERINRARALLAQPVAEGPSDEELLRLAREWNSGFESIELHFAGDYARAVLSKWGHQ